MTEVGCVDRCPSNIMCSLIFMKKDLRTRNKNVSIEAPYNRCVKKGDSGGHPRERTFFWNLEYKVGIGNPRGIVGSKRHNQPCSKQKIVKGNRVSNSD